MHLDGLNEQQLPIVKEYERHCSVVSCPGSGKTKTITSKIGYLLEKFPDANIGAVTFTKRAADEMSARISKSVGDKFKQVTVKTFNSMGLFQLGNKKKPLIPFWEQKKIYRDLYKGSPLKEGLSFEQFVEQLSNAKSTVDKSSLSDLVLESLNTYEESLRKKGKMDFSDQINYPTTLMLSDDLAPLKFDYLMIDEFQDCDEYQLLWIDLIIKKTNVVCTIVSDDDQSIYSFRGSMGFNGIRQFEESHNAVRMVLGVNYRSHSEIIFPAETLIKKNQNRVDKQIISFKGEGGSCQHIHFEDENEMAEECVVNVSINPGDWTIIARTNGEFKKIQSYFLNNDIPFHMNDSNSIFKKDEIELLVAILEGLAKKEESAVVAMMIIEKMSDHEVEDLRAHNKENLFNFLCSEEAQYPDHFTKKTKAQLEMIHERAVNWRYLLEHGNLGGLLNSVGKWLGSYYEPDNGTIDESAPVVVCKLLNRLKGNLKQRLVILERIKRQKEPLPGQVLLMTAHGAKGLEFPNVIIIGANENNFPQGDKKDSKVDVEEERRLFYVAATRAEKKLLIYSYSEKMYWGELIPCEPSRFISEADWGGTV